MRYNNKASVGMRHIHIQVGGWLAIPEPLIVEAAGRAGFDWVGLDLQHGAWDLGSVFRGIQILDLLNIPALVRIAQEDLPLIPRVLDQGASGIVLAMASAPEVVAAAIDRARYQPEGSRSYGGQRYGLRAEAEEIATIRPAVYAMVETREGVERIGEIVAVSGLAGVHVGPVDLGLGLGLGSDRSKPAFGAALRSIIAACHAAGLPVTMHAVAMDRVREMIELGCDELVLTSDIGLLRSAFAAEIKHARGMTAAIKAAIA
jgi:4-hydroxy-2-oxoheptanedioate aldolase